MSYIRFYCFGDLERRRMSKAKGANHMRDNCLLVNETMLETSHELFYSFFSQSLKPSFLTHVLHFLLRLTSLDSRSPHRVIDVWFLTSAEQRPRRTQCWWLDWQARQLQRGPAVPDGWYSKEITLGTSGETFATAFLNSCVIDWDWKWAFIFFWRTLRNSSKWWQNFFFSAFRRTRRHGVKYINIYLHVLICVSTHFFVGKRWEATFKDDAGAHYVRVEGENPVFYELPLTNGIKKIPFGGARISQQRVWEMTSSNRPKIWNLLPKNALPQFSRHLSEIMSRSRLKVDYLHWKEIN